MLFLKYSFIFLFLFTFISEVDGQEEKKYYHSYSIIGNNFINPGFNYKIGRESDVSNPYIGTLAPKRGSFYPTAAISIYWDPLSHVGLQHYYNLEYDIRLFKRMYIDYGLGIGFQTNFTSDNFVVDEDFEISRRRLNAHIYGLGNIFLGFRKKNDITQRSTFCRWNLFLLTPYNNTILPSLQFSIGKTF